MARQGSERKRARLIARADADLRAERERLRKVVADCRDSNCGCHWREWLELDSIRFLLGEDPAARDPGLSDRR